MPAVTEGEREQAVRSSTSAASECRRQLAHRGRLRRRRATVTQITLGGSGTRAAIAAWAARA